MDIPRGEFETTASYERRRWFVKELGPKSDEEYAEAVRLSKIWVNMILLGCRYPTATEAKIEKIATHFRKNRK